MKARQSFFSAHRFQGFGVAIFLLITAVTVVLWPTSAECQQPPVPKLALSQVEELVAHGVPDTALAAQIERRGLAFAPTHAILDDLRAKGAGPQTLAAITALIPHAAAAESPSPHGQAGPNSQKPRLTRTQLEQMLRNHARDDLVARQIRSSSIGFQLTKKIVDDYAAKGAGPETVAALREQIRSGTVEIHSEPGSQVLLDGEAAGTVGPGGVLAIEDVPEGNHDLIGKNEGYQDGHFEFTLANLEHKMLILPLEWLGGYLSVSAQPADATIRTSGPRSFEGAASQMKVPPGNYTVNVSLDGYLTQTRSFQVAAGEHREEQVQLAVDPSFIAARLSEAQAKLDGGDYIEAIEAARRILAANPRQAQALRIAAEAYWHIGDGNRFVETGVQAIDEGEAVTIPLMHVHNFPHPMVHQVTLTIDKKGITYTPPQDASGCKLQKFTEPYSALRSAAMDTTIPGATALDLQFIGPKTLGGFIKSDVDEHGYPILRVSFLVVGSEARHARVFGNPDPNYVPFSSPGNAPELMRAAESLINRVKQ